VRGAELNSKHLLGGMRNRASFDIGIQSAGEPAYSQAEVPPCAPVAGTGGRTASQLIRSVGRTIGGRV
jgi:hypothetical protein